MPLKLYTRIKSWHEVIQWEFLPHKKSKFPLNHLLNKAVSCITQKHSAFKENSANSYRKSIPQESTLLATFHLLTFSDLVIQHHYGTEEKINPLQMYKQFQRLRNIFQGKPFKSPVKTGLSDFKKNSPLQSKSLNARCFTDAHQTADMTFRVHSQWNKELGAELPATLTGVRQQCPPHTLEVLNILYIACQSPFFCTEKRSAEIEATFNTADVFTYSMQSLFYVSEQLTATNSP